MRATELTQPLLAEESRYRLLVDAITDYAIFMLDLSGLISSWNGGAARIKGYDEAEILGQHFSRFYTEEDRAAGLPQHALDTARNKGRFESEGWRVRKDGTHLWCHVEIDPIRSADGTLLGFAIITRDLSERKRAEESLKHSEEQFRLLVQSVTDYAIYMLSPDGQITNWNLGAQRIKGYSPDEIIGSHFSKFYSDEDRKKGEPQRGLSTAAREGRFENQGWRVRKDGTRFWASIVIDSIRNDNGELLGFAKVTRDITDSMEAQRTLEKTREALFQAQKMESIGRLTGGIAHDFNNLLMAVLGGLEIARKHAAADPKVSSLLDNAIKGAQRGVSLTQRMLAFARRQELNLELVDVPALVQDMTDLLQHSIGPQTSIETRFPLSLKPVLADGNQLELALLNLVVNANDAMPNGGLITIAAREEQIDDDNGFLSPGKYVCLAITDNGEGMDESTRVQAMEPFFTTKGVGKGTGLGLSMVHGLAEQSGGQLILESTKGLGTTAELWLPTTNRSSSAPAVEAFNPALAVSTQPLRVIAVDDDALVLLTTTAMLEDLGHTVYEAESAARALEILEENEAIDLVITDQSMPGKTGIQLAEAIKVLRPSLPVLLVSGYAEPDPSDHLNLPKLNKPFLQDALAQAIMEVMQRV